MTQNDLNFQIKEPYRSIILWIFGIVALISLLSPILFHKKPNRNYGSYGTWEANENFPIELEAKLDTKSGSLRGSRYTVTQLYLHANKEKFKCWFSSDSEDFVSTDYLGNRRYDGNSLVDTLWAVFGSEGKVIEISEVNFSIALGERAVSRDGLRYCSIKKIRFKHFSDIEFLASKVSEDSYSYSRGQRLYPKYLERYKKLFYH